MHVAKRMADLIFAAKTGQAAHVKMLLAGGADPNAFDGAGCTALYHCDSAQVCRLLIAGKADVHYSDRQYNSPLHMASTGEIAKLIMDEVPFSARFSSPLARAAAR